MRDLIAAINQFHYEVYASLSDVTVPQSNVLYLIGPTGTGSDKYEEYVYDSSKQEPWVKIGDTSIDLSGYVTTQALNTALAAKADRTLNAVEGDLAKLDANGNPKKLFKIGVSFDAERRTLGEWKVTET